MPRIGRRKPEPVEETPKREQEFIGPWPAVPLSSLNWSVGSSYQEIDPYAGTNSLQSTAFHAAVDMMASLVSEMRFDSYRSPDGSPKGRKKIKTPGNLLDPAGDGYGVQDWIYMLLQSWFLRGNAYGNILDAGPTGMLRQVDLFNPDLVTATMESGNVKWLVQGQEVPAPRMFHRRAYPVAGNLLGLSPVAAHADEIGLSIAATRFGRTWFQDGGHPSGILSNSEADMSDDNVVRTAKDRFLAALFGTREPIVLGRGWSFEQIQVNPEESQFLETRGYTEAQCARIMGPGVAEVLGYSTGSTLTYANIVDRDVEMLKYSANRWLLRVERILSAFLPKPQFVLFDRDSFLDTSIMQRWQVNKIKMDSGAYTINEVRETDNSEPVDWGKIPLALTLEAAKAPAVPPADPSLNTDPGAPPPDPALDGGAQ
jgi:HK97 family phage portal protein